MKRAPRHIYATDHQVTYLRRLNQECFAKSVAGYYIRDWSSLLRSEASEMIEALRTRLALRGMRGEDG